MMQSSWALSEAMTNRGRCSETFGIGPLILVDTLAKELKTFVQVIELLESRWVVRPAWPVGTAERRFLRLRGLFPSGFRGGFSLLAWTLVTLLFS